jgi:hypothetical protein
MLQMPFLLHITSDIKLQTMGKKTVNTFEISGKVLFVGLPMYIKDTLSKRLLVMKVYAGKYPQEVPFDFVNERMGMLDNVRINDWVRIDFELRGNKHIQEDGKARWFTNINGMSATVQREDDFAGLQDTN